MVHRGHNVFAPPPTAIVPKMVQLPDSATDIILHALIARITYKDNQTLEFRTKFDKKSNTIELIVPEGGLAVFDELQGIQQGPQFRRFIDWLIGRQSIINDVEESNFDTDLSFISSTDLIIWAGASKGNINDKLVIFLPAEVLSVVGYNLKMSSSFSGGDVRISLIWMYEGGNNNQFNIQTKVSIGEIGGNNIDTAVDASEISTFNLVKNDIRETELMQLSGIQNDDIVSILIQRNYDGSTDPQTDLIGILGIKVEKIV